jgi:hypothetical protein
MKTKLSILGILASILLIIFGCAFLIYLDGSGNSIFKRVILNPMPKSVVIIDSLDETFPFGDPVLLHFKIAPDDLNLILAAAHWEIIPDFLEDSDGFPHNISWWNPKSLGDNGIKYQAVVEDNQHERIQEMWINSEKNEVYYRVTFIH